MIRILTFIIVLVFAIIAMAILWSASAHEWYDFTCCNKGDCRQTALGEVERRDGGWFVVPTNELIPFDDDRIRRSLDPLIHRCVKSDGTSRCLYVPEVAG